MRECGAVLAVLFQSARLRAQAGARRARELWAGRQRIEELETLVRQSSAAIEALTGQVRQLEATVAALGSSRCASLQLPLTERAQALKMAREGRPARQIASTLGLPQGEILLLTRMQEIQNMAALVPAAPRALRRAAGARA